MSLLDDVEIPDDFEFEQELPTQTQARSAFRRGSGRQTFSVAILYEKSSSPLLLPGSLSVSPSLWIERRLPPLRAVCSHLIEKGVDLREWSRVLLVHRSFLDPTPRDLVLVSVYGSGVLDGPQIAPECLLQNGGASGGSVRMPRPIPLLLQLRRTLPHGSSLARSEILATFSEECARRFDPASPSPSGARNRANATSSLRRGVLQIVVHDELARSNIPRTTQQQCQTRLRQLFLDDMLQEDPSLIFQRMFQIINLRTRQRNKRKNAASRRSASSSSQADEEVDSIWFYRPGGGHEKTVCEWIGMPKFKVGVDLDGKDVRADLFEFRFQWESDGQAEDAAPEAVLTRGDVAMSQLRIEIDTSAVKLMTGSVYLGFLLLRPFFYPSDDEVARAHQRNQAIRQKPSRPFIDPNVLKRFIRKQNVEHIRSDFRLFFEPFAQAGRDGQDARRSRGILFYGPPGTGKSYLASELIRSLGLKMTNLKSAFDSARFKGGLVGETEKNIRFEARQCQQNPSVLYVMLLDECESLLSDRGAEGSDSRMNDALNTLLPIISNSNKKYPNLIFLACTNFKKRIDAAATRTERLDRHIFLGALSFESVLSVVQSKLLNPARGKRGLSELEVCCKSIRSMLSAPLGKSLLRRLTINFTYSVAAKLRDELLKRLQAIAYDQRTFVKFRQSPQMPFRCLQDAAVDVIGDSPEQDLDFNRMCPASSKLDLLDPKFTSFARDSLRVLALEVDNQKTGNLLLDLRNNDLYYEISTEETEEEGEGEEDVRHVGKIRLENVVFKGVDRVTLPFLAFSMLVNIWQFEQIWYVDQMSVPSRSRLRNRLQELWEVAQLITRSMAVIVVDDFVRVDSNSEGHATVVMDEVFHSLIRFIQKTMTDDVYRKTNRLCFGFVVEQKVLLDHLRDSLRFGERVWDKLTFLNEDQQFVCDRSLSQNLMMLEGRVVRHLVLTIPPPPHQRDFVAVVANRFRSARRACTGVESITIEGGSESLREELRGRLSQELGMQGWKIAIPRKYYFTG